MPSKALTRATTTVDLSPYATTAAMTTALSAKADASAMTTALALKANAASPAFTGTPTGLAKAHVGLGNVDNTADAAKPVSTAQQSALDLKAAAADVKITKSYVSTEQTVTAGGALTLAHGLGVEPTILEYYLVNQTAQQGYVPGDHMRINAGPTCSDTASDRGLSVVTDATNITIRYGALSTSILGTAKSDGAAFSIVNASWKLVVRAYA